MSNAVSQSSIAVLGAGSWGTALSFALCRNNHQVTLWGHSEAHVIDMHQSRSNERYLDGFSFPDNLQVTNDLVSLTADHSIFLIATPSHAFRETLVKLKSYGINKNATIIWATKGFDKGSDETGPMLLSDVIEQELGTNINHAIVSGPSFSKEVAANLPTAMTCAANNQKTASFVAQLFHGDRMRIYINDDLIGVQVGGAIKNVMAIAAGISDGLGFGANSRSAIITRGLSEIARLGVTFGAQSSTFQGLAGMGDLILTCTDDQSRNRRFGLSLGKGLSVSDTLKSIGQEVEGYTTSRELKRLIQHKGVEMPISEQVYRVIYQGINPDDAVNTLLSRDLVIE